MVIAKKKRKKRVRKNGSVNAKTTSGLYQNKEKKMVMVKKTRGLYQKKEREKQ